MLSQRIRLKASLRTVFTVFKDAHDELIARLNDVANPS